MADLSDYLNRKALDQPRRPRPEHPQGWEPGVTFDGSKGTITTRALESPNPNWVDLLRDWGFDPALYQIIEPVQVRTWEAVIGNGETKQMWYYRAAIASRTSSVDEDEIRALKALIARKRPAAQRGPQNASGGLVVAIADTQLGKSDGGGIAATVERYLSALDSAVRRAKELKPERILIAGLGDIIESCEGHYPQQGFRVERNLRDQVNIARRLVLQTVRALAPIAPTTVAAVGGNHGENRSNGKSFTDFADNWDVGLFEQVADICAEALPEVSFVLPNDELAITLEICGTVVGLAHGHQAKRSGAAMKKIDAWWRDQAHNRQPVGDADVLLTGHYHHLLVNQSGCKTHIQAPALDGGSDWWINQTGQESPPGMLTLRVGSQFVGGWAGLEVCR